ncbi:hypothetical protein BB560_003872 [Smittium megazygosporum]|uniref:Transcription initiation factor TFIID subunit 8 n=1 Tax=Smittium megazygosporum TaxID=133381 RepID=A0A2T9ZAS0_9FUNG|nr:hypothetical protein BB560_003872 [Smittium megazygosporum]
MSYASPSFDVELEKIIAFYLKKNNLQSVPKSALNLFVSSIKQYIFELGMRSKNYGELAMRSIPNLNDVQKGLSSFKVSIRDLEKFYHEAKEDNFGFSLTPSEKVYTEEEKRLFLNKNQEMTSKVLTSSGLKDKSRMLVQEKKPKYVPEFFPGFPSAHTYKSTFSENSGMLKSALSGDWKPLYKNFIGEDMAEDQNIKALKLAGSGPASSTEVAANDAKSGSGTVTEEKKSENTLEKDTKDSELNMLKMRAHFKYLAQSSLEKLYNRTMFPDRDFESGDIFLQETVGVNQLYNNTKGKSVIKPELDSIDVKHKDLAGARVNKKRYFDGYAVENGDQLQYKNAMFEKDEGKSKTDKPVVDSVSLNGEIAPSVTTGVALQSNEVGQISSRDRGFDTEDLFGTDTSFNTNVSLTLMGTSDMNRRLDIISGLKGNKPAEEVSKQVATSSITNIVGAGVSVGIANTSQNDDSVMLDQIPLIKQKSFSKRKMSLEKLESLFPSANYYMSKRLKEQT